MKGDLVYKALGLLLTYPEQELVDATGELDALFDASELSSEHLDGLTKLTTALRETPLLDLQEAYVRLFDRSTRLSLYLYEHVHGESRDRGQAMVDLQDYYKQHGVVSTAKELPDYVPILCEFCSMLDNETARAVLSDAGPVLALLGTRLADRKSHYAVVFDALVQLAEIEVDAEEVAAAASDDGVPVDDSFEALDRIWEETEITFGEGDALDSCGKGRSPQDDLIQLRTKGSGAPAQ
ncbi:MAG: nitrate reductase molybdenum cofactor assembly chaperone [Polyangiaceae bacterium]|nr:nitrate reductase molybdenum cofactor assembly chaperone [Polyangiaceae bacterium]